MCGIVGIASAESTGFSYKELEAFETMLFLDTLRGWDSTGVFGVTHDKDVFIAKEACHGPDFLKKSEYKDIRSSMSARGKFFVGHNRAATRGTVNDKNAHPFWVDDKIVLVQNGTYKGSHKHHKDVEVDTEAIAHVIAENEDVEVALNKINAAYALVWYNVKQAKLNLIRNAERPLYLAVTKSGSIWFASEAATLLYAAHRHDVKFDEKPYMMDEHTLVTMAIEGRSSFKLEDKELTVAPPVEVVRGSNFVRHGYHYCGEGTETDPSPFVSGENLRGNAISAATREAVSRTHHHIDAASHVTIPFTQELINHFPKYHMDPEVGRQILKRLESPEEKSREITVELEDYVAANNNRDCTIFHVFGRDTDPKYSDIVYHWIVKEDSESDVLEMCSGCYYTIKPGTAQMRLFERGGFKRCIVTRYGLEAKLVYSIHQKLENNVNVH